MPFIKGELASGIPIKAELWGRATCQGDGKYRRLHVNLRSHRMITVARKPSLTPTDNAPFGISSLNVAFGTLDQRAQLSWSIGFRLLLAPRGVIMAFQFFDLKGTPKLSTSR